jgi:hypothetical protein
MDWLFLDFGAVCLEFFGQVVAVFIKYYLEVGLA